MDEIISLPTLDDLSRHVRLVLARADNLDPEQAPMSQEVLLRSGRPCGLFFQIQGPRRVKAYAVWAGEEGRVLYYDSQGRRFAQTRLSAGPDPARLRRS